MKRNLILVAAVLVMAAPAAQADVTFDFNPLVPVLHGDTAISNYMTNVYGSSVTTNGARVGLDLGFGMDPYIFTDILTGGDFDIWFNDVPVKALQFQGHVFRATRGADFRLKAWSGGSVVFNEAYFGGEGTFNTPWIVFSDPVDHLRFSNSRVHDVGIDDLQVEPVPAPAAVVLGAIGLGLVAWMNRRFSYSRS